LRGRALLKDHPNIKNSWLEWEIKDGRPELILVVVTDLEIRPQLKEFNGSVLEEILESATEVLDGFRVTARRVRIVPQDACYP
jgi:hypothetical protein